MQQQMHAHAITNTHIVDKLLLICSSSFECFTHFKVQMWCLCSKHTSWHSVDIGKFEIFYSDVIRNSYSKRDCTRNDTFIYKHVYRKIHIYTHARAHRCKQKHKHTLIYICMYIRLEK